MTPRDYDVSNNYDDEDDNGQDEYDDDDDDDDELGALYEASAVPRERRDPSSGCLATTH